MIVRTTVGNMLGDCTSTGMITDRKRYEIDAVLYAMTRLTPFKKIRAFKQCTGYRIQVNGEVLERDEYGTKIIISDRPHVPVKQKQYKSIW